MAAVEPLGEAARALTARERATLRMRRYRERMRDADRLQDDALQILTALLQHTCKDLIRESTARPQVVAAAVDLARQLREATRAG